MEKAKKISTVAVPNQKRGSALKEAKHSLSKSRFCAGVQCTKMLYFKVHEPELAPPVDPAKQMIFDQGTAVGIEARKRHPGGVLIQSDYLHSKEAIAETQVALLQDPPAIFEAALVFNHTLVRIDILVNNGDGSWDIVEVKSTTKLKDEHLPDLAIQRYVAEGSGLKVRSTWLRYLNRECVYPKMENLFSDADCTEQLKPLLSAIPEQIEKMLSALAADTAPKMKIGPHCSDPYDCDFKAQCWKDIPEHSVFELNGVWDKTKFELYERGIIRIVDIPEDEKVSRAKTAQLMAVRSGKPVIDHKGLSDFLNGIEFPIYFLDFETMNPAIPYHEGLRPYGQFPFQFSCHVLEADGGQVKHFEYLGDGGQDPRVDVAKGLVSGLGKKGTILVFNQSFEKTRIKEMADQMPSLSNELLALLPRFADLRDAFTKHYCHPDFHGSFSIKDILPVLVPSMTYEGLEVSDGGGAQVYYQKLGSVDTSEEERKKLIQALLQYCRQDTLAMVELLRKLKTIAQEK